MPAKIINGITLQQIEGNYFFIFDWFEGKAIEENEITIKHVQKVATLLAKLHNIDFGKIKDECNLGNEISEIDWESSGVVNPCEELLETAWDWSEDKNTLIQENLNVL